MRWGETANEIETDTENGKVTDNETETETDNGDGNENVKEDEGEGEGMNRIESTTGIGRPLIHPYTLHTEGPHDRLGRESTEYPAGTWITIEPSTKLRTDTLEHRVKILTRVPMVVTNRMQP
ncbi:hypothetical protein [Natronosalvus vescus]|uniref:hypothetical protein n=1 Tax=Natronosalvus vescus TaxID=2953881 RepID=UPI002091B2E2|nr:hypothetical protein [Natronosalvus vescus]